MSGAHLFVIEAAPHGDGAIVFRRKKRAQRHERAHEIIELSGRDELVRRAPHAPGHAVHEEQIEAEHIGRIGPCFAGDIRLEVACLELTSRDQWEEVARTVGRKRLILIAVEMDGDARDER